MSTELYNRIFVIFRFSTQLVVTSAWLLFENESLYNSVFSHFILSLSLESSLRFGALLRLRVLRRRFSSFRDSRVSWKMTTMESLIGLVNRIQRACTVLGDYGGGDNNTFSSLWEALPSVAVVGGQVRLNQSFFYFFSCFVIINFNALNFLRRRTKGRDSVNGFLGFCVCFFQQSIFRTN